MTPDERALACKKAIVAVLEQFQCQLACEMLVAFKPIHISTDAFLPLIKPIPNGESVSTAEPEQAASPRILLGEN
jgi:hypothetical protein